MMTALACILHIYRLPSRIHTFHCTTFDCAAQVDMALTLLLALNAIFCFAPLISMHISKYQRAHTPIQRQSQNSLSAQRQLSCALKATGNRWLLLFLFGRSKLVAKAEKFHKIPQRCQHLHEHTHIRTYTYIIYEETYPQFDSPSYRLSVNEFIACIAGILYSNTDEYIGNMAWLGFRQTHAHTHTCNHFSLFTSTQASRAPAAYQWHIFHCSVWQVWYAGSLECLDWIKAVAMWVDGGDEKTGTAWKRATNNQ